MEQLHDIKIILASASPYRKAILTEALKNYDVIINTESSDADESEMKKKIKEPGKLVEELSCIKAQEVYSRHKDETSDLVVIGADTIAYFEGEFLGKPKSEEDAVEMLSRLQSDVHQIYTGMTVIIKKNNGVKIIKTHDISNVFIRKMNNEEIWDYVKTGEPMDKAGSYTILNTTRKIVERYEGDFNTVVGLDTAEVEKILVNNNII